MKVKYILTLSAEVSMTCLQLYCFGLNCIVFN